MKALTSLGALALFSMVAFASPALAHDGDEYPQFYTNTNNQFDSYPSGYQSYGYPSNAWGNADYDHAFHAQQHASDAWQHAQYDMMYASPEHAAAAVRHAIMDSRHAQRDAYRARYGGWYY